MAEWRRIDLLPLESAAKDKARSCQDLVPEVFQGLGLDKKRGEAEILKVWSHVVDPNIVQHAHPVGLKKGTLYVKVDSNVWLSEIVRFRRHEIMHQMRSAFGEDVIQKISFYVG